MPTYFTSIVVTATAIGVDHPLAARELAQACGADLGWVVQLVEVGIIATAPLTTTPDDWCFDSTALQCALDARRLERDFGVGLEAAALILDLQHEVRQLRAALQAQGR
jgi:chaperone modulatory protein CbpM